MIAQRNSNVEIYRIIATFAVLIVHFNGWFVGGMPEKFDFSQISSFRIGQAIIESATCICINMFLVISGYFGVHLKVRSIVKICLLLIFVYVPFYFLNCFISDSFSVRGLFSNFFVISKSGYFVQCYLMLLFLSPVLNTFIEKGTNILLWVFGLVIIELWFNDIKSVSALGFGNGYSVMHFITMYMVGRCLQLYHQKLTNTSKVWWIAGYIICTFLILLQYLLGVKWAFDYSNPLNIVSTICSFLPFTYYCKFNNAINWIASSTFAVYIIQVTNPVYDYLVFADYRLLESYPYGIYLLLAFGLICFTFTACIIYDKVCSLLVNPMSDWIAKFVNCYTHGRKDVFE